MEQYLGLPPDGSAHGPAIDHLIGLVHWLMLVLFIGWGTFYILTLIRFRRSRQAKANYTGVKSHFSSYLEVGVLVAEVILLAGFSIPLWSKRVDAFPAEKDATVVRIVAEQFAWNVHYPGPDGKFGRTSIDLIDSDNPLGLDRSDPAAKDDITTINQLNLPAGKPVIIYLSSKDVVHSFNLPDFRVKQDVIPGQMIPVWFTPTKTTDQIRQELVKSFPVAGVIARTRTITLPQPSRANVSSGLAGDILMADALDSTGNAVVSKGEQLTGDDLKTIRQAGVTELTVRPAAGLDRFITLDEVKDSTGAAVVSKSDQLSEDAVNKFLAAGIGQVTARPSSNLDIYVAMADVNDASGNSIVAKGAAMSEDILTKLGEAGIKEVPIAPATPTEIACAQLCGLGHFRMRGYMTVQTPEEFKAWVDQQEAALQPQSTPDQSAGQPAADSSGTQGTAN